MMLFHLGSAPTANKCPSPGLVPGFLATGAFLIGDFIAYDASLKHSATAPGVADARRSKCCRENLCVGWVLFRPEIQ